MRLFLVAVAVLAPVVRAETVPIDPKWVIDCAAAYYRGSPAPERVEVRAFSQGQTRADDIIIAIEPPGGLRMRFGDLVLWSDSEALRVFHRLDERGYYEEAVDGRDVLAAVERLLPPFPLPQLALAFADDPSADLTAYARGVRWTAAEADAGARPARATAVGEGERCGVSLTIESATGRITSMTTTLDGGRARIELTATPLPAGETPTWDVSVERRRRVEDLTLLRPRPGFVRVGDALPDLGLLEPGGEMDQPAAVRGPTVLILYRNWKPGGTPRAAIAAGRRAAEAIPGLAVRPVLVLPAEQPERRAFIDAAATEVEPMTLTYSLSPGNSIERFAEDADLVLAVIDARGMVRGVIEPTADERGPESVDPLAERIVAAAR